MRKFVPLLLLPVLLITALPAQAQQQPEPQPVQSTPQLDAAAIAQQFINLMANGDFATALQTYDNTARQTVTAVSLEQNWQDIITENGAFQSQLRSRTLSLDEAGQTQAVVVTCQFENGVRYLFISFTPADRIVSFTIVENE